MLIGFDDFHDEFLLLDDIAGIEQFLEDPLQEDVDAFEPLAIGKVLFRDGHGPSGQNHLTLGLRLDVDIEDLHYIVFEFNMGGFPNSLARRGDLSDEESLEEEELVYLGFDFEG